MKTIQTSTTVFIGTDETITTELYYFIETPMLRSHDHTTVQVTIEGNFFSSNDGNNTRTINTYLNTFTGSNGVITTSTLYIIATPLPTTTITEIITLTGTGYSSKSTISIDVIVFIGYGGTVTYESIYIVTVPKER